MLRSFRVTNHRSLRNEQELLLMPAVESGARVLPVAAVFGANASGKSNLVDALGWMDRAVQSSYRSWEAESGVPRDPYRLDDVSAAEPSDFTVELILDGVQVVYGFTADQDTVIEEWLHSYPDDERSVTFERRGRTVEFGPAVRGGQDRAELLGSLLRDNALLLSTAVQAGQEDLLPVYRWFRDKLRILGSQRSWARTPGTVSARILEAAHRHPEFADLLRAADLGISGVEVVPSPEELDRARHAARLLAADSGTAQRQIAETLLDDRRRAGQLKQEVNFLHGKDGRRLGLADQSHGTLAWADLLLAALSALEAGAVLVIDEIDASLHPRLTARLVELFRNDDTNRHQSQLVFTTHDATLLGSDLGDEEVLARDEIWFVEKREGASALYPLSDFEGPEREHRESRYLAGSYGAVPALFTDTLVDSLRRNRTGSADAES
ncbi:ATP/GTP-binding protein [Actinoplanes sp. M2I2]|uniref:AAA family ATPase n=1 Tax=Actinoplanes sp. M2I2 TaxID=1734444 RepID=UPI00202034ED|nr:ATP-binding protein [Actinoplanes sp. M2I2]